MTARLGSDVRDPKKVTRFQIASLLQLTFERSRKIEIEESKAGNDRGWRRTYRGKKLPYQFRLRLGCIDMSDKSLGFFYKRLSNDMGYDRKVREREAAALQAELQDQTNREEVQMRLERLELVEGTSVRAIIKAHADVRDEAIISQLRRGGPMTYSDLADALAGEPQYAGMTPEQRRKAIVNRVRILRQRGLVEVHHRAGKHGPTAFVSIPKSTR